MLQLLARTLIVSVGLVALYVALFMYEDEEGRWQNRIDELWISVDDRARKVGNRTTALFNQVGRAVNLGLNRLFGEKLFSVRMVAVSTSLSIGAVMLFLLVVMPPSAKERVFGGISVQLFLDLMVGACLAAVALLTLLRTPWVVPVGLIPLAVVAFYIYSDLVLKLRSHTIPQGGIALSVALPVSIATDVLLNALVRSTVRKIATSPRIFRIMVLMLILLLFGVAVSFGPLAVVVAMKLASVAASIRYVVLSLYFTSVFNVPSALPPLAMAVALLFVVLHRAFWPVAARLVYPLARYRVIHNPKLLIAFGTGCVLIGLDLVPHSLKNLLQMIR